MTLTMRKATRSDLDAIVLLLSDDMLGKSREDATMPAAEVYRSAFEEIDEDKNQFLAVADADCVVVGCLQLTFIPGLSRKGMLRGQIESVRTLASQRGKGLGGKMIRWAIDLCRQRGCGLVQLTTDKTRADAQRFYSEFGFVASHEGMKLNLSD